MRGSLALLAVVCVVIFGGRRIQRWPMLPFSGGAGDFDAGGGVLFQGTSGGGLALSAAVGVCRLWEEEDPALAEVAIFRGR